MRNRSIQQISVAFIFLLLLAAIACTKITEGSNLSKAEIKRINQLYKLSSNEVIINFYSEYKSNVAGNFYTNKGVANYWVDKNEKQINYAFYKDIISMDTIAYAGATYSPYIKITKSDSASFKLCFDGTHDEVRIVFKDVLNRWEKERKSK